MYGKTLCLSNILLEEQTVFVYIRFDQTNHVAIETGENSDRIGVFTEQQTTVSAIIDSYYFCITHYFRLAADSPLDYIRSPAGNFGIATQTDRDLEMGLQDPEWGNACIHNIYHLQANKRLTKEQTKGWLSVNKDYSTGGCQPFVIVLRYTDLKYLCFGGAYYGT